MSPSARQVNAGSAAYGDSTGGGALISYTSDFVTLAPNCDYDLSISLSSLAPLFAAVQGNALNSFRAYSIGSASSEPTPTVNAVPEPWVWGLMIVGFGLVGVQVRRCSLILQAGGNAGLHRKQTQGGRLTSLAPLACLVVTSAAALPVQPAP
jgi:hypothetical protein